MFELKELSTHEITVLIDPTKIDYGATEIARVAQLDAVRQIVNEIKRIDGETRSFDAFGLEILGSAIGYKKNGLLDDLQSYLDSEKPTHK